MPPHQCIFLVCLVDAVFSLFGRCCFLCPVSLFVSSNLSCSIIPSDILLRFCGSSPFGVLSYVYEHKALYGLGRLAGSILAAAVFAGLQFVGGGRRADLFVVTLVQEAENVSYITGACHVSTKYKSTIQLVSVRCSIPV